jgi:sulfite reductase (NADPH) flavoprotein alpha-component
MILTTEPLRWGGALLLSAGYLAMCLRIWHAARPAPGGPAAAADWLVVYASQTGSAEYLARRTAATLVTGGLQARAACMSDMDAPALAGATNILFVASTYGEGDAPDNAARFAGRLMAAQHDLSHLHYAVLALGDSSYANYCGFGRTLDAWLARQGASPLFERIDVDRGSSAALAEWQHHVGRLAGTVDAPDWAAPAYGEWRIAERVLLNPGSAGSPLYRLALVPLDGPLPAWEAGDLAQLSPPSDPEHPREYSIASLPQEGRLELLVRLQRRDDGTPGAGSGWLCERAQPTDTVHLRVRAHERFRLGANARRPLIAIGNGSGLAGLRALLKARIHLGEHANWLLFGERQIRHDFLLREELLGWQDAGWLERLDLAFSRDNADAAPDKARYVQHLLRAQAADVDGGVHEALGEILGTDALEQLVMDGRYRRDVY